MPFSCLENTEDFPEKQDALSSSKKQACPKKPRRKASSNSVLNEEEKVALARLARSVKDGFWRYTHDEITKEINGRLRDRGQRELSRRRYSQLITKIRETARRC